MFELSIILFGAGSVGRALISQILGKREFHARHYGLCLCVLAVCDSTAMVSKPGMALQDSHLQEILTVKGKEGSLIDHSLGVTQQDLSNAVGSFAKMGTVVVDCTASSDTVCALLLALDKGCKIVLANKKPLTMEQEVFDRLAHRPASDSSYPAWDPGLSRWEATVGSGLPVITTLNRLKGSGDTVHRIAGSLSSTLGSIMTGLQEGRSFSNIVREVHQSGYTEPDPREDLGGTDVARKALILVRGLGWKMDLSDVEVVSLYPPHLDNMPATSFLEHLPHLDSDFTTRTHAAAVQGHVLRYVATIEGSKCRVGLNAVATDSPLGRLKGADNLIEIHSRWYSSSPLVIQGRGDGVNATAAGVLSDIIELGFSK